MESLLTPPCSARRSLVAALAVAPLAYCGGLTAMREIARLFGGFSPLVEHLEVAALVVVWLSVAATSVAGAGRSPGRVFVRTVGLSMVAAVLCTPATILAMLLVDHPSPVQLDEVPTMVVMVPVVLALVTLFGAMAAIPAGLPFAVTYGALLAALAWTRRRFASGGGSAWVVTGATWCVVAVVLADPRLTPPNLDRAAVLPATLLFGGGLLAIAVGAFHTVRVIAFARRVAAGRAPGWGVSSAGEPDASLPRLAPLLNSGRILVRTRDHGRGPFRDGPLSTAVARM